jgi:tRNA(fMet)-specific endonuclease VapC
MKYFLDTNILIYYFNGKFHNIRMKLGEISQTDIFIPSVVATELFLGALKSARKEYNYARYQAFLEHFRIVPFDFLAAGCYAEIRAELENGRKSIGWNDLLIAATVKANDGILVTNNTQEFSRVPGLTLEDWTTS